MPGQSPQRPGFSALIPEVISDRTVSCLTMHLITPLVLSVLLIPLLAACSTSPLSKTAPAPVIPMLQVLGKGATEAQVRAAWGEPKSIRPFRDIGVIWTYEIDLRTVQQPVAATMVEVPYLDPITEVYTPVQEPSVTPQTTTYIQTIELLMVDGKLNASNRRVSEHRSFN